MISFISKKGVAFCLSFFCFISECQAHESFYIELGSGFQDIRYSEMNISSFQLNKETGLLPQVSMNAGFDQGKTSLFVEADFAHASIDYDGYTQSLQPLETTTDTTRITYSLGALYRLEEQFAFLITATQNYWDREIQGTSSSLPLDEYYHWRVIALGADVTLFEEASQRLNLRLSAGKFFDEELEIDLSKLGYGSPVLPLKGDSLRSIGISYLRNLNSKIDLKFDLEYLRLKFDQSDTIQVNNSLTTISLHEPESRTSIVSLNVGFRFKF